MRESRRIECVTPALSEHETRRVSEGGGIRKAVELVERVPIAAAHTMQQTVERGGARRLIAAGR